MNLMQASIVSLKVKDLIHKTFQLSRDPLEDKLSISILVGHQPDQAVLSGVLNSLYNLRLPLLSVKNLDEK
jgi:hypothetical protein